MIPYLILIGAILITFIFMVVELYRENCLDFSAVSHMLLIVIISVLTILKLAKI